MAEKVKVSREVAKILDRTISNFGGDKAFIIANYVKAGCGGFWRDDFNVMRELSNDRLFKALYVGYEIEETPEETILATYKSCKKIDADSSVIHQQRYHAQGYAHGILFTLNELGVEIEGINK